jgi:hypothetical protein
VKKCFGLILIAACGGSATLSGRGSFTVNSEMAAADAGYAAIFLANVDPAPVCSDLVGKTNTPFTGKNVEISVVTLGQGALLPGTFNFQVPNGISGTFASLGLITLLDGGVTSAYTATSGTITLTGVGGSFSGSFSADLSDPSTGFAYGTLTGDFSAPTCSL